MGKFSDTLAVGKIAEARIDEWFVSHGWVIRDTNPLEERHDKKGDRFMVNDVGVKVWVEYKTDLRAHRTGNVFIEILSVLERGTPGWALTNQSDYTIVFTPDDGVIDNGGKIFFVPTPVMSLHIKRWINKHRVACSGTDKNDGYHSVGILVPVDVLTECAGKVAVIPPKEQSNAE